jgi:Mg2+-importing ATPase
VPGDIVMVETGDVVPADMRIIEVEDLTVDESVLTGESAPANKKISPLKKEVSEVHLAENLVFSGTLVVSGKAMGIVIGTNKKSVMGEVSKLTIETVRESAFEKGIAKFSSFILKMIVVILVLLFAANVLIKGDSTNIPELILFSIALAVSVIPEALPLVTTLSLSRGALRLARDKVVVKRLSAVEDLGSIEVLCSDKTGTITENKMKVAEVKSQDREQCLFYGALASSFLGEKKAEPNNAFDLAMWNELTESDKKKVKAEVRVKEIPFDPSRRRNDVLIKRDNVCELIVRGALEDILPLCIGMDITTKNEYKKWAQDAGKNGQRILAIAVKSAKESCDIGKEEKGLKLLGTISFVDPIKSTTKAAISEAGKLGVKVKILTGDAKEVAGSVAYQVGLAKSPEDVITGEELEKMSDEFRIEAVEKYNVFARVSPQQKYLIIQLLQRKYEVGFLGEGINDAPALKLANVAMVVEGASDIAREAADIVLLSSSLAVIVDGIKNGREIFANTIKYLKITLISNFGNFYAIAVVSLIITYLPMLPVQILLLNLLSDFPMIAIAMDTVDTTELRRPHCYNVREVVLLAIFLGIVSTVFDFIFFALFHRQGPQILQTNWFIGSVLTELALIYSVRTHFFFLRTKAPSIILALLSVIAVAVAIIIPFTNVGLSWFRFVAPSLRDIYIIIGVVVSYFVVTELVKLLYYKITTSRDNPIQLKI